jgi:hypothetical protein
MPLGVEGVPAGGATRGGDPYKLEQYEDSLYEGWP